jgi:type IV secretory pathway VirB10-like protein
MMPAATPARVLAAALVALALFAIAFLVARSGSSDAPPPRARVQPVSAPATLTHVPLRAIGSVPALPRAPRKPKPKPGPSAPATAPPPAAAPPAAVPPPPPPPPPPSSTCVDEFC